MILFLVSSVLLGVFLCCLPMLFLKDHAQERYVTAIFAILNLAMAVGGLFSFYAERLLTILFVFFYFDTLLFFIVMNGILVWKKVRFHKNYRNLLLLVIPIAVFGVNMLELKFNASERLAFKIEFPRIQHEIEEYQRTKIVTNNIRLFGNYTAVMWDRGFLDSYRVILYDENDNLQELSDRYQNKTGDGDDEQLKAYEEAFRYEKIVHIVKLADNYYRCNIHE